MPTEPPPDAEWTEVWDARLAALAHVLGPPADVVFHATIPFQFREVGGSADVVPFPKFVAGVTYVTAELTGADVGQRPNSLGHYELMICTRDEMPAAADFVARLAAYTCDDQLEPGQTMDIGPFFEDATLRAVVFAHPRLPPPQFDVLGQRCGLLLCVGVTAEELAFAQAHGTDRLVSLLEQHGVFPYTIPDRHSVPLTPSASSRGEG